MNGLQNGCKLVGYWAMTLDERERHDTLLLNEERWKDRPACERKRYLETLLLHTFIGYNVTLSMLDDANYEELREQIKSVLGSFSCRQEKLLQYIEKRQAKDCSG